MAEQSKKIIQGTKEWFALRKGKITGTRIQKAAKECIWTKGNQWDALARDMFREENGLSQDPFDARALYAISYGKDNEPKAIQRLKDEMGFQIQDSPFVNHPDYDWLGMSPDGIILNGPGGGLSAVEIKCPQTKPVTDVKKQKRNYWHQMQLGMECMDIDKMLFFQWYEDSHYIEWVDRDPDWADIYIPKAKEFMDWYKEAKKDAENITSWSMEKTEPGVPYKDIEDNDDTKKLASVLLEIKVTQQKIKELDAVKKELSERLVKENNGAFRTSSVKCHLTQATGRIDYKRLIEDKDIPVHEVEGYRSEGATRIYTRLMEDKDAS